MYVARCKDAHGSLPQRYGTAYPYRIVPCRTAHPGARKPHILNSEPWRRYRQRWCHVPLLKLELEQHLTRLHVHVLVRAPSPSPCCPSTPSHKRSFLSFPPQVLRYWSDEVALEVQQLVDSSPALRVAWELPVG